jgi:50S ribosomal protein L16 3-hydroxylase
MHLNNFDIEIFLKEYWQKKPLLIKNAFAQWSNPIDPDELAGLACEEGVESRLIEQSGETWKVEHGPLTEKRFGALGKSPWTMLVQAVDHHVPQVAALMQPFRFIPNWRIDDIMVSYATDDGGVGPHFDQYDVFLIQGLGRRRWQVGALCDEASALLPHDDLRLLANFEALQEWVLEPGDILYVPPRISHNGVAVGDDCMTYSIGFRAPSRAELIGNYTDDLLAEMDEDDRYGDPALKKQNNPGEIDKAALEALHKMITQKLSDQDSFARWFGKYNSTRKYPDMDWSPDTPIETGQLRDTLTNGGMLCRNPASRFNFIWDSAQNFILFVDGESYDCSAQSIAFAEALCAHDQFVVDAEILQSDAALGLIASLYNQGSIAFADDE